MNTTKVLNVIDSVEVNNDNINWDILTNQTKKRNENKKVKKHPDDHSTKIYCHESYAQTLYDMYYGKKIEMSPPAEGSHVQAKVISKTNTYAAVDIGWRDAAYIDLTKENKQYISHIKEGVVLDIIIKSVQEGSRQQFPITASYTDYIQTLKKQQIKDSIGTGSVAYKAMVSKLIHGGFFLDIDGVEVFMPGSLAGMNIITDFDGLVGQELIVIPINYSREKDYIVVSHREYLKTLVPSEANKIQIGKEYKGRVTDTAKFGVFVEFENCLTGLIYKTDLDDDTNKKFLERTIKPGDEVTIYPKEKIKEAEGQNKFGGYSFSLTQKPEQFNIEDPWTGIEDRYKIPCRVTGRIRKVVPYGVFIEIEKGVSGLLHKSEYEDLNMEMSEGNEITIDLWKIDKDQKKLFFNL